MSQLRLVFSNNMVLCSPPPKPSRASSSKRSSRKASTSNFLRTMAELERANPAHANVLERLARQMIARAQLDISTE